MKMLAKFPKYQILYHSIYYSIVRAIVGTALFIEGIKFAGNRAMLFEIVEKSRIGGLAFILEHHVIFTLLVGGLFIAIGLLTRVAILFELLIFIGVLLNPHAEFGLYSVYGNFGFSLFITLVLIILLIAGSGHYSVDYYFKKKNVK